MMTNAGQGYYTNLLFTLLSLGDLEQFLAHRGTLLQPGRTLKDMMAVGYVYLISVDKVTYDYLEIAKKEYEAHLMDKRKKQGSKRRYD